MNSEIASKKWMENLDSVMIFGFESKKEDEWQI